MKSQPLTHTELDDLSAVLERFGDQRSMNLEQLDGFFAALICGPELVPPSKYLPKIWGDQTVFEDTSAAQMFMSLLMRHWNAITMHWILVRRICPYFLRMRAGSPMGTIGHTASYVEWSSEKRIGLFC
jgi:hypothetical protein